MLEVRRARNGAEMDRVYQLTYEQYLEQGYISPNDERRLRHYPHLDGIGETHVLVAVEDGTIVGTNSVTLDGPNKLHVDGDAMFAPIVQKIREECLAEGRRLGCSWRIVTDFGVKNQAQVILELIGATFEVMGELCIHTTLYTFNPKHEAFYSRMLGFHTLSYGECDAINSPPAVLMISDYRELYAKWERVCAKRHMPFKLHAIPYPDRAPAMPKAA